MQNDWSDYDLATSEARTMRREIDARIEKLENRVRVLENALARVGLTREP